ncbi:hypothetical protein GPUN_1197 [Glaciecola punicea ACAM 611]|uniref:Uncharacterized protein n=1 Tax=Glaciecola punicea ACAM 611 TaxID=1121923 RepID=H5TAJ4_9ALTE|nr:hypothetical protein GPUN_1197 [Glaciecola punicea ACAM 611]
MIIYTILCRIGELFKVSNRSLFVFLFEERKPFAQGFIL